jgi:hypothetical protein
MKQQIIRSRIVYSRKQKEKSLPEPPPIFSVLKQHYYITDQKANPTQHTLVIISSFSLLNSLWGSGVRVETERERDTRRRGTPLPPP